MADEAQALEQRMATALEQLAARWRKGEYAGDDLDTIRAAKRLLEIQALLDPEQFDDDKPPVTDGDE